MTNSFGGLFGLLEYGAIPRPFVAILQNARPHTEDLFRGVDDRNGVPRGNGCIENGIKTWQSKHVLGCRGQHFLGIRIATLGIANDAIGSN